MPLDWVGIIKNDLVWNHKEIKILSLFVLEIFSYINMSVIFSYLPRLFSRNLINFVWTFSNGGIQWWNLNPKKFFRNEYNLAHLFACALSWFSAWIYTELMIFSLFMWSELLFLVENDTQKYITLLPSLSLRLPCVHFTQKKKNTKNLIFFHFNWITVKCIFIAMRTRIQVHFYKFCQWIIHRCNFQIQTGDKKSFIFHQLTFACGQSAFVSLLSLSVCMCECVWIYYCLLTLQCKSSRMLLASINYLFH